jgi:D-alanine--poly(phosphoribitol) ligase subunit 2
VNEGEKMNIKEIVLEILEDLTGTDEVRNNLDLELFEEGLLDSIGVVEMLVALESKCGVSIPPSDFDRAEWSTPGKAIERVTAAVG